jgi:hypothetical protein
MKDSNNLLKPMDEQNLPKSDPIILAVTMLRPFYFICMIGYIFQICAGLLNMYNLVLEIKVTPTRLTLNGLAIFFSWMDMYTLTSTTRDTGIMSTAFISIFKSVRFYIFDNFFSYI